MAPSIIYWRWPYGQERFREMATEFTIHNDVGDWSDEHGLYLMLTYNDISGTRFYFGLQTDIHGSGGKGVIFSRWGTRDLANARHSDIDGWTQSSGHEGDFIGVRRSYNWTAGDYRITIKPDGLESDGEWFALWITEIDTDRTTWIGSLKFPLLDGTATMRPQSLATLEIYGHPPIRPIDIPKWHVSVKRPWGDGIQATWGSTSYPYDDSENALFNSAVWYEPADGAAHLVLGGTTEGSPAAVRIDFPDSQN